MVQQANRRVMERDRLDYININACIWACLIAQLICVILMYFFTSIHIEKGACVSHGVYIGFAISWLILTIVKIVRYLKYEKRQLK